VLVIFGRIWYSITSMKKIISVIVLILIILSPSIAFAEQGMAVYFVDVGQGDCTIFMSDGNTLVIDIGPPAARDALEQTLYSLEIEEIDLLVLTHPHDDHDGNFAWLIQHYRVHNMWMPEYADDEEDYGDWLRYAVSRGTQIRYPNAGDAFHLGSAEIAVLSAGDTSYFDDKNLWSIVTRVDCGDTGIIVTGDAVDINEFAMIDAGVYLDADVLRVGHHGSYTSTTEAFVDAISPDLAIISCGANNSYGHPHAETLTTLASRDILALRTDQQGTISIVSDGINYRVHMERRKAG
jgi:competence protein ComEC